MSMNSVGLKAYGNALKSFQTAERQALKGAAAPAKQPADDFSEVLKSSLDKVNGLQSERNSMVQAFASGQDQNVHELMIAMQKAGLAMNLTSAVRSKVLEAYKELTRIQF